ncbi:MAG: SEC-C metal-binding domain-containing protein [Pirellulaceae bacterium]
MVTRRIEAAQKKVEERHFEARKNLLEYDEVMDMQRKRVYGFRQQILNGRNCREVILEMVRKQIEKNLTEFMQKDFGTASFAAFASNRLSCPLEAKDFRGMEFSEADTYAKERAERDAETTVQDSLDENLPGDEGDEDAQADWNWEAMAKLAETKWGVKVKDWDLKKIGRDNVGEYLLDMARKAIQAVDLAEGKVYLEQDFQHRFAANWVLHKFGIEMKLEEILSLDAAGLKSFVTEKAEAAYDAKEAEYPAMAGLYRYLTATGGKHLRLDGEGLMAWARQRFETELDPNDLNGKTRDELFAILANLSRQSTAKADGAILEARKKVENAFSGADAKRSLRANDASRGSLESLAQWAKAELHLDLPVEELEELNREELEIKLLGGVEDRYRPEMRRMERSLLLQIVDNTWKDHLYVMEKLRSSVGLVGYAQVDPKVEYKKEGMKLFEQMWQSIDRETTDLVFKMERLDEDFVGSTWVETSATHAAPPGATENYGQTQDENMNAGQPDVKPEPIKNRGPRVGRNDPCPCGSGKKYKQCCMRLAGKQDLA